MWVGLMLSCSRPVSWQVVSGSGDPGDLRGSRGTCERERETSRDRREFPTGENRRGSHEVGVFHKNLRFWCLFPPSPLPLPPRSSNLTRVPDMTTRLSSSSSCLNNGRKLLSVQTWTRASGAGRDKIFIYYYFLIFWIWFAIHGFVRDIWRWISFCL